MTPPPTGPDTAFGLTPGDLAGLVRDGVLTRQEADAAFPPGPGEIAARRAILAALEPLDGPARARVAARVAAWLGWSPA